MQEIHFNDLLEVYIQKVANYHRIDFDLAVQLICGEFAHKMFRSVYSIDSVMNSLRQNIYWIDKIGFVDAHIADKTYHIERKPTKTTVTEDNIDTLENAIMEAVYARD